jgi:hypothetical protein
MGWFVNLILRAVHATDNHLVARFLPFQDRSRTYAELPAYLRRHGDLPLCRNLRPRDWQTAYQGKGRRDVPPSECRPALQ